MEKLCRGCVVKMKQSSGMQGWGNDQCVSGYIEPLGEVYLFGHNQGYHDYDVEKVVSRPASEGEAVECCEGCGTKMVSAVVCPFCYEKDLKNGVEMKIAARPTPEKSGREVHVTDGFVGSWNTRPTEPKGE